MKETEDSFFGLVLLPVFLRYLSEKKEAGLQ